MTAITFQTRVQPWLMACFGAEIAADRAERNHRFLEESLELVQSCGCTASEAHQLVDYVFGRPVGEPAQEAGGVMVTLAALCLANSLDMHQAGETELARIWTKVEAIRAKQAAKPKHSPLPAAPAAVAPQGVAAWMTPEGDRVVTAETMDGARKDGGASLSSLRPYTVALVRAGEPAAAAPALEAPAAPESAPWCPDVCPITGRPFFMWIEHWQTGKPVPTYGGPYDSYTIPVKDSDGSFECERYDHDEGGWLTEWVGWHCLGVKLVDDQSFVVDPSNPRYNEIEAFAAAAPQAPNCTRCSGSGEDPEGYLTHGHGPDDHTVDGPCRECDGSGAAPQAPRLGEDALHLLRRLLSNQHTLTGPEFRAELEKIVAEESARHAAAPQAPAAPSPYSAELLAALGQWHQRCEVMGAHHTLTEAQIAELVVAGLLRRAHGGQVITTAGRVALAAPDAPAVDAETIHLQDLKNALAECAALRQQLTLMDEQQTGTVWRWQADGQDQLASMGNRMGVLIYACDLRALLAGTAPAVDALGERDAAFEAVRNRLCGMQRYSFVLDDDGAVRRVKDRTGNWVEFDDAHALFDPVAVDAAIAAQAAVKGSNDE